jgi:hypothetical protein
MSCDKKSQGLAAEQPLPDQERIYNERQEWMKEFAYVLIDMFNAQRKAPSFGGTA